MTKLKAPIPDASSFFRQMIDLVPHFIFAKDMEGRFILVNKAVAEAYGTTVEALSGNTDADFASSPEEAEHFRKNDLEIIATGWPKHLEESITDASGKRRDLQTTKIPFTSAESGPGVLGVAIDITERKIAENKITYLAHHDHLTGLPNRSRLDIFLREPLLARASFALLFVDLDHFKQINDSLGHAQGDAFLQVTASRIRGALREGDFVCRAGGDEFIVVLLGVNEQGAQSRVEELLEVVGEPLPLDGMTLSSTCSIGVAIYPTHGETAATLMKHADAALYGAKARGRNTSQVYTRELSAAANRRLALYNGLRMASRSQELELHFQPIIDGESQRCASVEALLRWNSKDLGAVSPNEFISLAEETGLIRQVGDWVVAQAFSVQRQWRNDGLDLRVGLNLSARQLLEADFEQRFRALCVEYGGKLDRMAIELTEGVFLTDAEAARRVLTSLANSGVRISIDDFGVGYSSLGYLRKLPISDLKIDRSFVHECVENPDDASLIRTIVTLAKNLRLKVVAEGVETRLQADFLSSVGCDFLQGFFFGRPVSASDLALGLRAGPPPY